ncbi:Protein required for ethanol metabolism [Tilletia horrida]|nr:Protein required for ethanol metabolism [Tilletia horrida]
MAAAAGSRSSSFLQRFFQITQSSAPRKCATTAFTFGLGDVIAQQFVERRGTKHDLLRTTRLAFYGGVIFSPYLLQWFKVLDKIQFKNRIATITTRVAVDQTISAPIIVTMFLSSTTLLAGGSTTDVKEKLRQSWWSTVKTGWLVWVPTQTINISVVPQDYRLIFLSTVALCWNVFLSVVSANKVVDQQKLNYEVEEEVRHLEAEAKREIKAVVER